LHPRRQYQYHQAESVLTAAVPLYTSGKGYGRLTCGAIDKVPILQLGARPRQ
jgi:hypothetical protein